VCVNVDEGTGVGHQPDVQKQLLLSFRESILESDTPPTHGLPDRNIFGVSGMSAKRMMLDRGGGCLKSHFLLGRL